MQTRISVALNGIPINSLDGSIVLQGVDEQAPNWNLTASTRAGLIGQHYINVEKRYRDVIVRFALANRSNYIGREGVLNAICRWAAKGGKLTLSYRPDKELRVVCVALPAMTDMLQWANPYQITFRAYDVPQWINTFANAAEISTANGQTTLSVVGTSGGKLRVNAVNNSGSVCDTATIISGGQTIQLTGLGLANGETLILDYTDNDIQRIRIKSASGAYRSVLAKRSVTSVDDIWLNEGPNQISVTSGVVLDWTLSAYGRWI